MRNVSFRLSEKWGTYSAENVPVEWLKGSVFHDYFIPSLILFIVVGGSALFAAFAVFKRYPMAQKVAIISGVILLCWLGIQVTIIGYVSWMQPITAIAALLILVLAWKLPNNER